LNRNVIGLETNSHEYNRFRVWWHQKLFDAGFVGIAWPEEYGGRGGTVVEQYVFNQEVARHRAPGTTNDVGLGWAGPTIMAYGTEEQKKRFLPRIISAEDIWSQCFSETEAGSDLANLQARGVEDGGDFIINGQKIWTTEGDWSDWAILLVRTNSDPDIPKHRGLTYFLLDMHSPGVTVRSIRDMTGGTLFTETFLDDVRIPKSLMVGEKDRGWYVAMATLDFERTNASSATGQMSIVTDLIELAGKLESGGQPLSKGPLVRQKLARFYIEASVIKYIGFRVLSRQIKGEAPGMESTISSIMQMELGQRLQEFALELQGPYAQLVRDSKHAVEHGIWQRSFLFSRGDTIKTGSSEIKRNIIAQRALGLPRE